MKNKLNFPVLLIACLSGLFFVSGELSAQSENNTSYSINTLQDGDVPAVSARIAAMYGGDVQVVERYVQAAINLESRIGVSAPVVLSIAIHESSFKSELFEHAGNPFRIKAGKPWVGPTYSKWEGGEEIKYRVYGSPEEAILDFGNFVKSRTWYLDVLDCPIDDSRCVIDGLKKTDAEPGYSMNPNWDEAVMEIIQKVGLQSLVTR